MSAAPLELAELFSRVQKAKCESLYEVRQVVEAYFEGVVWSLLKGEWNQMDQVQRDAFIANVYFESRRRNHPPR